MRYPNGDWAAQSRAGAEERWIRTQDGVKLNCAWYPLMRAHIGTLFLHGNAGNITHRIDHALSLRAAGSAALVLDYRGYGKSDGHPSEQGLYADAEAGYQEMAKLGYGPKQIVIHGESLGCAVATNLAAHVSCAGLILESPFASLSAMAAKVLPVIGPLLAQGFNTVDQISKVRARVFVIHGDADEIVPFQQGEAVFAHAREPKQFWRIPHGMHNSLLSDAGPQYVDKLRAFYASI